MFFSSHPKHLLPFLPNAFHQLVHHSRLWEILDTSLKPFDVTLVRRRDYWQSWPHGIVQIERQNVEFMFIIDRNRRGGRRRRRSSLFGISPFSSSSFASVDKRKRRREPAKKLALPRKLLFVSTRKPHAMTIKTTRRHHRRPHLLRHKKWRCLFLSPTALLRQGGGASTKRAPFRETDDEEDLKVDEDDDFSRVLMIALMILRFEERVKADGGETSMELERERRRLPLV